MARGLAAVLAPDALTVVVNVGDDAEIYGVSVAADLDTVTYTLAGVEGPDGWGRRGDTFETMAALADLGVDTAFRLGDTDLATCLARTIALRNGDSLSSFTAGLGPALGVRHRVLPVTDDTLRTRIRVADGTWLDFQDYFVLRGHRDTVLELRYDGAETATPAPGVFEAVATADVVVIAPSNPPLSIWPILAVPGLREVVEDHHTVIAVSPLIGGRALRGPADRIMATLGLPEGNEGVLAAYQGLLSHLVVDRSDVADVERLGGPVEVVATDTRITEPDDARRLAVEILGLAI